MHPRSPYANGPTHFGSLAQLYTDKLGAHVKIASDGYASFDFRDPNAARALTETLLLHDFGVHAEPPSDRLCPAVPNRTNYVLWLQDLLANTWTPGRGLEPDQSMVPLACQASIEHVTEERRPSKRMRTEESAEPSSGDKGARNVRVLDIGTGACVIYALIGCALDERWSFTGTDIDATSLEHARKIINDPRNVARHKLDQRIQLVLRDPLSELIPMPKVSAAQSPAYHVTMCNPPFYASEEEMRESAELKEEGPSAVCSGVPSEMITQGGEVAFVSLMIDESCRPERREGIIWYTSMLGKLSSVAALVDKLKTLKIDNYGITEFTQGRTRRWALAWSHIPHRLPDPIARPTMASLSRHLPPSTLTTRVFPVKPTQDPSTVLSALFSTLKPMADAHHVNSSHEAPYICARFERATWSRAARRARALVDRERMEKEETKKTNGEKSAEPMLSIRCSVDWEECVEETPAALSFQPRSLHPATPSQAKSNFAAVCGPKLESHVARRAVRVNIQWTYGRDRAAFEACTKSLLQRTIL